MTPDAIMIDEKKKQGNTLYQRIDSVATIAESILKLDRSKGQTAHIRRQPGGKDFVTGDPTDTIRYPTNHAREGQARYNWVVSTDDPDIQLGYLKDKPAELPPGTDAIVTPGGLEGDGNMRGMG